MPADIKIWKPVTDPNKAQEAWIVASELLINKPWVRIRLVDQPYRHTRTLYYIEFEVNKDRTETEFQEFQRWMETKAGELELEFHGIQFVFSRSS